MRSWLDMKLTKRPSAEISTLHVALAVARMVICEPSARRLTRVVVPVCRSRTNTSCEPLVSSATRSPGERAEDGVAAARGEFEADDAVGDWDCVPAGVWLIERGHAGERLRTYALPP